MRFRHNINWDASGIYFISSKRYLFDYDVFKDNILCRILLVYNVKVRHISSLYTNIYWCNLSISVHNEN